MAGVPGDLGRDVQQHPAHLPMGQLGWEPRCLRHGHGSVERDLAGSDPVQQRAEAGHPVIELGEQLLAGVGFDRRDLTLGAAFDIVGGPAHRGLDTDAELLDDQADVVHQGGEGELADRGALVPLVVG